MHPCLPVLAAPACGPALTAHTHVTTLPRRAFAASELRLLRAAVGTFYDLLALAVRTAERFGSGGASGTSAAEAAAGSAGAQAPGGQGAAAAGAGAAGAAAAAGAAG